MSRFYWLYGLMLLFAAWLARVTDCPSLFLLPPTQSLLIWPLVAAVAMAVIIVGGGRLLEDVAWYRDMAQLFKRTLSSPELLGSNGLREHAFTIGVYSAIGEEAFFRGWVQPWLISKIGDLTNATGPSVTAFGIVATSLIFGLLHFPVIKELRPWTAFAILAGIAFGVLAAWSGSLLAPVLAHLLINWLNLRRLAAMPLTPRAEPHLPSQPS